jgi:iron complex outermembrane receptor protein
LPIFCKGTVKVNSNKTTTALRAGTAAYALGLALISAPSFAQTTPTPDAAAPAAAADSADQQTIIVTGSRIARPLVESPVPVSIVSAKSIQDAGQTNVLDALRDLPIAGQSLGTSASNFQNSGNGTATVNLRNLGISRTLVLINGRRSVGIPGDSAVDLNTIPVDMIDHVEVITGGASAIYGSDAVAGVVNIILKNNFNGLNLHVSNMISSRGDGATPMASVLAGKSFADGRGNITAGFTYTKADGVPSSARAYSKNDSPSGSAYTPQGVFFDSNGDGYTFDNNNNVLPYTGTAAQRYNRASERLLTIPVERYTASVLAHFDFSPAAQLYGEFTYNHTKASGHIEPLAVDDGGTQGQSVYNFDGSAFPGISVNSPYVPAAIKAAAPAGSFLDFFKRSNGLFDRSPHDSRDYFRGVIGLKGDLGSGWNYDLSYEHSQVRDDTSNQSILMTNYGAALQATTIGGQIVCADPVARAAGCVPINPFGHQAYTAAQLKFLSTYTGAGVTIPGATVGQQVTADFLQKSYQDVASLAITGSLFNLPNGPLGVAFGGEFHREKVSENYDPFTRSIYSSQQLNGNETGKYNSKEAFVEVKAPIYGGHPGVYEFSLNGAARYANYTTVGSTWTYEFSGSYAPVPDIHFRAAYARAVRAPNLNELYSPKANTAQQVTDPCDQYSGNGPTNSDGSPTALIALPAACNSIPGVSATAAAHGGIFGYSLAQVQTIFGYTGGNADLKAEATNTITAGATFTPQFLRNFVLTADYYSIKVKNAIAEIDPQFSVNQCFQTGDPNFCGLVHRNSGGLITEVDQVFLNASSYKVAGIDVQAQYNVDTNFFSGDENLSLSFYYNHKLKQEQTPFAGGPVSNELGTADTYASQQLGTGFKDQFTFNLNYRLNAFTLNYRLKYLGPVSASEAAYAIPTYTYSDFQVKFDVDKKYEFYVGVNNAFDKQPPFIAGGNSQWPGTNTVADTYDVLGRMIYAGAVAKF